MDSEKREMNIFLLDTEPEKICQYHPNKLVVKMCTEYTQILNDAIIKSGGTGCYKAYNISGPFACWAVKSVDNWLWLYNLAIQLAKEYRYRYGKTHKAELDMMTLDPVKIKSGGFTLPPITVPGECIISRDPVECYRYYFKLYKNNLKEYTNRPIPEWWL